MINEKPQRDFFISLGLQAVLASFILISTLAASESHLFSDNDRDDGYGDGRERTDRAGVSRCACNPAISLSTLRHQKSKPACESVSNLNFNSDSGLSFPESKRQAESLVDKC
jgi:hypothetical protein